MQIEDNQNDDFHRTDLEGGDEPADDEMMATPEEDCMMAAPEEDCMMEPLVEAVCLVAPNDDDYMGERMSGGYPSAKSSDDGMSEVSEDTR